MPTCLVVTSSESASSVDTQFAAMCEELKLRIGAITINLDEKKCANMKSTIDHLQSRLRVGLGMISNQAEKNMGLEIVDEGYQDAYKVAVQEEPSSEEDYPIEDEKMHDENEAANVDESRFVSSL